MKNTTNCPVSLLLDSQSNNEKWHHNSAILHWDPKNAFIQSKKWKKHTYYRVSSLLTSLCLCFVFQVTGAKMHSCICSLLSLLIAKAFRCSNVLFCRGRWSAVQVIHLSVNGSLSSFLLFQVETWMTHLRMNLWHQTDTLTRSAWPPSLQVSQVWA